MSMREEVVREEVGFKYAPYLEIYISAGGCVTICIKHKVKKD